VGAERTSASSPNPPPKNAQYKDAGPATVSAEDTQPVLERAGAVEDKQSAKI